VIAEPCDQFCCLIYGRDRAASDLRDLRIDRLMGGLVDLYGAERQRVIYENPTVIDRSV
jgi:hypothetical protein